MAYTFAGLKTKLQTQIGDPSLDSTVSGDAVNYAQQDIFNKFELTLNSGYQTNTVAAGANTMTTALPADFQRITALYITNSGEGRDLTGYFVSPKEFRRSWPEVSTANPISYWTFFTEVEFSTLADKEYSTRMEYIKTVDTLSDDADVPTIPQAFEELLMLGAKIRVYEQKEDFDYARQYDARYNDILEQFVDRYATRQVDGTFVVPGSRRTSVIRKR